MEQKTTKTTKTTKTSGAKSAPAKKNTGMIIGIIVAVLVVIAAVVAIVVAVNSGKGDNAGDAGSSMNEDKDDSAKTKTVGTDEYGYVVVPEDWEEVEAQDGFQYGNSKDGYYVSMLVEDASELSAEDWAKGVETILEQGEAKDIKTGKEKLGDLGEAHVVSGFYTAYNRWLKAYTIDSGDKVYYIAIEGPEKDSEEFKIPETFKLKK